ncbi:hypothetical protein OIU76_027752 [Salix suchowensis]|nr:hypothetical protein OIU78_026649 [Salix suchowensis]KAJ6369377.1 hypothetical protein OIU76_027752 [Salix suchowensis]
MPRKNEFGAADDEATHPDSMRAALAEFVSTFVFVFAGEGSVLALDKMYKETGGTELASGLVVGFHVQSGGGVMHGLLLEMALTFGLVYTV